MKQILFILIAMFSLVACDKTNQTLETVPNPDNSIFGTWKYTENYISPGSLWHWETVDNGAIFTINADSNYTVTNNAHSWPFAGTLPQGKIGTALWHGSKSTYLLKEASTDTSFFWPLRVNKDTLELAKFCIEGCIFRFRKIK